MIQSIIFFTLGFLCAAFLALMVAPAIWRRATVLTRRRIEATVPLSLNELQADKDKMRAEFAMSTRRLELSIQTLKEKATSQIVDINRKQQELKRLADEQAQKNEAIGQLEAQAGALRGELREREQQLERAAARIAEAEARIQERAVELERMARMYDEASFTASSRQIELVARESELERVSGDVSVLRGQRKDADARLREVSAENKAAQEALKAERRRVAGLEKKLERLTAAIADREEKLDRREQELARLREQAKGSAIAENDLASKLAESEAETVKLEAEMASLTMQLSTLLSGSANGGDLEKAMARLAEERTRMEERIATLMRENKALKGDLGAQQRDKTEEWETQRKENALLREQINDLAAEVVNLTALLDGPDSPIEKALAESVPSEAGAGASLADRVRALRQTAAAGRS